jgi:hypothetical protein
MVAEPSMLSSSHSKIHEPPVPGVSPTDRRPAAAKLRNTRDLVGVEFYGRGMPLSVEAREQFLAEPHVAALSVAAGPTRGPLSVPIWYQYRPGGEAWVLTPARSRKAELIEAAGRFTLMVRRIEPTVRYVSVEVPVTQMLVGTDEQLQDISTVICRRRQPWRMRSSRERTSATRRPFYLRPERWLSADLGDTV